MIALNFSQSFIRFWKSKPPWCQPWSLLLTGSFVIFLSWLILKNLFFTLFVSLIITIWWILFLVVAPLIDVNESSSSDNFEN